MTKERRSFTAEERLSILQEGERDGHTKALRKYQISPSLYTRWKQKYLQEGISGLKYKYKKVDPALREQELEKLILNKETIDSILNNDKDPATQGLSDSYWSSSYREGSFLTWAIQNEIKKVNIKDNYLNVRAIRKF